MTRRFLVFLLCSLAAATLLAQVTNMGPAGQYYKTGPPKKGRFSVIRAPKKGGEAQWTAAKQTLEKDEYAILEGDVKLTYGDIHLSADKVTYNKKTADVTGEGHV